MVPTLGSVLQEGGPGGGSSNGNGLGNTTRGIFPSEKGDVQSGQIRESFPQRQRQKKISSKAGKSQDHGT